jgi:hypothetical protein
LRNQFTQAVINGIGAAMLSAGWLYHHLGDLFFLIPALSGLGTAMYYFVCSSEFTSKRKKEMLGGIGVSTFLLGGFFYLNVLHQIFLGLFVLGLVFYIQIPGKDRGLRDLPGVKGLFISLNWLFFVLLFPIWLLDENHPIPIIDGFSFLVLFFALTIPSDVHDIHHDPPHLYTLPQSIGSKCSGWFSMGLILTFSCLQYLRSQDSAWILFSAVGAVLILISLITKRNVTVFTDSLVILAGSIYFL